MSNEAYELTFEVGGGDPRRCKRHGTVVSSDDGMFDGLCGKCESEADDQYGATLPLLAISGPPVDPAPTNDDDWDCLF